MSKIRFVDPGIVVNASGGSGGSSISSSYALSASYADFATSASYAVSASHEIIKEVSSSYADTASFAQSGNGIFSGSFSGSYVGDGSGLTDLVATDYLPLSGGIMTGAINFTDTTKKIFEDRGQLFVTNDDDAGIELNGTSPAGDYKLLVYYGGFQWWNGGSGQKSFQYQENINSIIVRKSSTESGILDFSNVTSTRTYSLPNATGTIALLNNSGSGDFQASGSFSGSFQGNGSELIGVISSSYSTTASYVETAQTASYVLNAVSSSYAVTASHALNTTQIPSGTVSGSAQISSLGFVTSSATASFVTNSQTSSMSVLSASFAVTASHALNIIPITPGTLSGSAQISDLGFVTSSATASFVTNSQTSSMSVLSASFAVTASHLLNNSPPFPFTGDAVISGSLTISGSLLNTGTVSIDHTDSPYTITGTQQFILIDPSGGDVIVNMPDASTYPGRQIFFKLTQAAGANTVTLQRQGSDTIDGATEYTNELDIQYESISTVSDGGTGWFIF